MHQSVKDVAIAVEKVATPASTIVCLGSLAFESTTGWVTVASAPLALGGAGYRLWKHRNGE